MNNEHRTTLPNGHILRGATYCYEILQVLGQGSFGITYLARVKMEGALGELDSSMYVAIKEFFMREINGREGSTVTTGSDGQLYIDYKKKFLREAEHLSNLRNSGIVKVLETFEQNNTIYYVMEHLPGGSLDKRIGAQGMSQTDALRYAHQIADALNYMHQNQMLHLDLKPGNIMLDKDGNAVLIDFGLSKQYTANGDPESSTTIGGGTPGYAPLEQANYQGGKTFPATMDVYALGGTLFKMLTGQRPPMASEILNERFPTETLKQCNVSPWLIAIVRKAMMPQKKDRYQSIGQFADALNTHNAPVNKEEETEIVAEIDKAGEETQAIVSKTAPIPQKKGRKNAWIYIVVFLLLAITGGGVAYYMLTRESDTEYIDDTEEEYDDTSYDHGEEMTPEAPAAPATEMPAEEEVEYSYEEERQRALQRFCGSFSVVNQGTMESGINYGYELKLDPINSSCSWSEEGCFDISNEIGYYGTMMQWPDVWKFCNFSMSRDNNSAIAELRKVFPTSEDGRTVTCTVLLELDDFDNISMSYVNGDDAPGILIDEYGGYRGRPTFVRN